MKELHGEVVDLPKISAQIKRQSGLNGNVGSKTINIGEDGATFIPSVSEDGILSWSNDKDLPNPEPVNIKGDKGDKGDKGENATSPTVTVSDITGGHRITITDVNGTKTVDVMDGNKGDAGRGISTISRTSGTGAAGTTDIYTITYTDKTTSTFTVYNGKDGTPGTSVTVKSVSESTKDGGSNVVTFSDGKTVTVKNGSKGSPGYTPQKGTDYFTPADKSEIVDDVLAEIEIPEGEGGKVQDVQINGTSILDENGVANIPQTSGSVWGVVRVGGSANGEMHVGNTNGRVILRYPVTSANGLTNRKAQGTQYGGVVDASNFDLAVKTAMTDGKGAAWTEAQMAAARARMGAVSLAEVLEALPVYDGEVVPV